MEESRKDGWMPNGAWWKVGWMPDGDGWFDGCKVGWVVGCLDVSMVGWGQCWVDGWMVA